MRAHQTHQAITFVDRQHERLVRGAIHEQAFGIGLETRSDVQRLQSQQRFHWPGRAGIVSGNLMVPMFANALLHKKGNANGNHHRVPFVIADFAVGQESNALGNALILRGGIVKKNGAGLAGAHQPARPRVDQMIVLRRKRLPAKPAMLRRYRLWEPDGAESGRLERTIRCSHSPITRSAQRLKRNKAGLRRSLR